MKETVQLFDVKLTHTFFKFILYQLAVSHYSLFSWLDFLIHAGKIFQPAGFKFVDYLIMSFRKGNFQLFVTSTDAILL